MIKPRSAIGALVVSGALLVGIAQQEGYVETATPPVKGDVPTNGFGTTHHADGSAVRAGEKTTPTRAMIELLREADGTAAAVRRCAPVPMYQHEFDAYVDLAYNIGTGAFCGSTIVKRLNAGDYPGACEATLMFKKFQGHDCSAAENQRLCGGIWTRRQTKYRQCMGESQS